MNGLDRVEAGYDVVVVGARAGGAATAMLLARRGLRVLAVDRGAYGTDTLSTHALMRAGVLQLARWGLLDAIREAGTPTIRATTFHYADEAITIPIKDRDGVDGLYAPRRTVLDPILLDAAEAAGAEVVLGHAVVVLHRDGDGRVRRATIAGISGRDVEVDKPLAPRQAEHCIRLCAPAKPPQLRLIRSLPLCKKGNKLSKPPLE